MARFQTWIGFITTTATITTYFLSGCSRNISVSPTLPIAVINSTSTATPTNTTLVVATNTPTNSPTSTASFTPTSTPPSAATNTATATPTKTLTSTTTNSPTLTVTATPTNTGASTATATPTNSATATVTSTPTTCVPTFLTNYTFDSGTQCWNAWGSVTATISQDTTIFHGGTGSLKVVLPFTTTAQQEQIGIQFPSPGVTILPGSTISFWVMASNNGNAMQVFDQSGPSASLWDGGDWTNAGGGGGSYSAGTWFQMSYVINPGAPTSIIQFGLQVPSGTGAGQSNGSPVTIWIDDVTITPPSATNTPSNTTTDTVTSTITDSPTQTASATPTDTGAATATITATPTDSATMTATDSATNTATASSTSTPTSTATATFTAVPNYSWTFEDGSVDGFYVDYNSGGGDIITPNSYANLGITNASGGVSALDMTMLSAAGNDMQIESNYVWNPITSGNGFPINFIAIGAVGVRVWVYPMTDATGSAGYGAANYVKTTSGDIYGTGGLGGEIPGGYSYIPLTVGQWTEVSLQPSGPSWTTDETSVSGIGVEINVYGGTQAATGDYIIDNMELY